ncbi:MAG: hypothetical protein U5J98_05050 [Halobacteriales archaeon]|nr:hypothetical protein [Halobacteriales archaeon]
MTPLTKVVTATRVGLVVLAAAISALTVRQLTSMPPPPSGSDGFAHGMAAAFGGGLILVSLGVATIGIITPSLLGRHDPLRFTRPQRLALKAAGGVVGLGVVLALVAGLEGVFLLLVLVVLAYAVVLAMLLWRAGELVAERRKSRAGPS